MKPINDERQESKKRERERGRAYIIRFITSAIKKKANSNALSSAHSRRSEAVFR